MKKPIEIITEFRKDLSTIPDKKEKVNRILDFVLIYGDALGDEIMDLLNEGAELSKEINYKCGEVICHYNLLFFSEITMGHGKVKQKHSFAELTQMLEEIKEDKYWYPFGLNLLAFFHWFRGEYEKGFNIIFEATKLSEGNIQSQGWNNFAVGVFYFDTKDFDNAKIYYKKAHDYFAEGKVEYGQARAASGMASADIMKNNVKEALPHLEFATSVYRKLSHHAGLSRAVNDWGLLEKVHKNWPKAIELLKESIELRKEINHFQGLVTSYTELGEIYLFTKNYSEALEQFTTGLNLALEVKTKQKQMRLYKLLYDTYKELKNTDLALLNFEKYYEIKSELLSDEATNNIKKIQTKFEKEKSEKEAEIERLKNVELKIAYKEIEEKNKEIIDSITYALRIQNSLLPTDKYIERTLNKLKYGH